MERWKDVKGYEGYYKVSDAGRIKSLERTYKTKKSFRVIPERFRTLTDVHGYLYCELWKDGEHQRFAVHRLVATAFIPNPDGLPQVNHLDGNKHNNNVFNLEWCNQSRNNKHAFDMGLKSPYNRNGASNPMYGRTQSESAKAKIAAVHRGLKHTTEAKQKMSKAHSGVKFSEAHKRNLSESIKNAKRGIRRITKDGKIKFVKPEELDTYLSNGWQTKAKGSGH